MKKRGAFAVLLLIVAIAITACGPTYYIPYPIPTPDKTDDGNVANDDWYDGNESAAGTYVLRTVGDILGFAELVENGTTFKGQTVELVAGQVYDFSEVDNFTGIGDGIWSGYGSFKSIPDSERPFMGTFDGNDAVILNLDISYSSSNPDDSTARGFFDMVFEADIKNIRFVNASVVNEGKPAGVAIGFAVNSKISGIDVSDSYVKSGQGAGGIVGSVFIKELEDDHDAETTIGKHLGIENCQVVNTSIYAMDSPNAGGITGQMAESLGVKDQAAPDTVAYFRNNIVKLAADDFIKADKNAAGGFIGYGSWWNKSTKDISGNRIELVSAEQITSAQANTAGYIDGSNAYNNVQSANNNTIVINGTEHELVYTASTTEPGKIGNVIR